MLAYEDYNEGYEDYCEKCDNTGWYRSTTSTACMFVVEWTPLRLASTESLVTWAV
jgi:hypothetical protein